MSISNLSQRSLAALQQMGVQPLVRRKEKAELALVGGPDGILEQRWIQDLLLAMGQDPERCVLADTESAQPAKRYWVFGQQRLGTATHLYLPSERPSGDEKRRIWRSLQRWQ